MQIHPVGGNDADDKFENIMSETKYILRDTFNDRIISTHRTIEAAVKAEIRHAKAVKRANGKSSYIPTQIIADDGSDISELVWMAQGHI